jgi:hypothetical protein
MKMRLKTREAFIIYQALNTRLLMLKTAYQHNGKLAKRVDATKALRDRLFPAPVVIPDDEEI